MPEPFKGFTLNIANEPEPWAERERTLFKDIIDLLVPDKATPLTDAHHHSKLYRSDDSAVAVSVNATGRVHIAGDAGTIPALASNTFLLISNTSATGDTALINILAGNTGSSIIYFGDTDSENPGRLTYNHNINAMDLWTNNTRRVRIDSAGRIGVGTAAPNALLELLNASAAVAIRLAQDTNEYWEITKAVDNGLSILPSGSVLGAGSGGDIRQIGFGTAPSANFHVKSGDDGFAQMRFEASASTGMTVEIKNTADSAYITADSSTLTMGFGSTFGTHVTHINLTSTGTVGIGVIVPAARLHVLTTTEQLRLSYDGDNNTSFTVSSAGALTIQTAGSQAVVISNNFQVDGSVGFYGTTPIAQQTGVAVTAAGIHAAIVALGLFTA